MNGAELPLLIIVENVQVFLQAVMPASWTVMLSGADLLNWITVETVLAAQQV